MEKNESLIYTTLSKEQTNTIIAAATADIYQLQRCMQKILGYPDWELDRDIRAGIVIDYYVTAIWWAVRERNFSNPEQISVFFNFIYNFLTNIKDYLPTETTLLEIKRVSIGVGLSEIPSWTTAGIFRDVFSVDETKQIVNYINVSIFQHYLLYHYFYHARIENKILRSQLMLDLIPAKPKSNLQPLCEAMTEEQYNRFVRKMNPEDWAAKRREVEAAEDDVISKLSPDVVCQIIHSVFDEMLPTFESDFKVLMRQKENALIARINKVHVVQGAKKEDH